MDEENEQSTIIIDIGTSQCKIGSSGENSWPHIVPTCVGYEKPKSQRSEFYWNMSDYYKTINKNYSYPIKHGIITDFWKMKDLYDNIFERELRKSPEFHKLFITQPIFNPLDKMEKQAVEKNGEIMILYTGDVRCGIDEGFSYAGLKALRDSLDAQGYTTILVDGGDAIQGGEIGKQSRGEAVIDLMNALDYNVAVPGDHETDYGDEQFLKLVRASDFPYISCNFER